MKIREDRHPGEPWLMWGIGNVTAIDSDMLRSVGIAWLFIECGRWRFVPRITGNVGLFYNSIILIQLAWPFGVFWSPSSTANALWPAGIGWKLNGRLANLFRVQSEASSAAGATDPNVGQPTGFEYGTDTLT